MPNFLMEQLNLAEFPPPSTHVKGIPIITFKGLLWGISTRIMLYHFAKIGTFNNKAISTLCIESFFSSLSKADFTMTGCPKATQIHRTIPIMMMYNTMKHNPDKKFAMDVHQGVPYPGYELEPRSSSFSSSTSDNVQFKAHKFDLNSQCGKKHFKCNPSLGDIHSNERGKLTVLADHYKINSKLTVAQKLNIPQNFTN